jgi:hypothetical protein
MEIDKVKEGAKVQWIRRNGAPANGVVREVVQMTKGHFVKVENVCEKGKALGTFNKVRASQLSKR